MDKPKRLKAAGNVTDKKKKDAGKYILPITKDEDEAVEMKIKALQVRVFGKAVAKFDIEGIRRVWIPYGLMMFDYHIDRKTLFSRKNNDKEGKLCFIYDYNEAHQFQFDEYELEKLKMIKHDLKNSERTIVKASISGARALEDVTYYAQERVLRRVFGTRGNLKFTGEKKFYRAAVEMQINYGKESNYRYAYLDDYGVNNEQMVGLRYRIM